MNEATGKSSHGAASVWPVLVLLVLALAVRGLTLLARPGALAGDPDSYRALAENVVSYDTLGHGESPTAYRSPLYPLVLVPCVALGGTGRVAIGVLHLLLGVGTVWITYRLGLRWGLGRLALLAAALVAVDPILLAQSAQVMTETLAALLGVAALWTLTTASQRPGAGWAALAGAVLGLGVLCRPTFLPVAAAAVLVLPLLGRGGRTTCGAGVPPAQCSRDGHTTSRDGILRPMLGRSWRHGLLQSAALVGALAVIIAPWAIRNAVHFGRPIVTTSHGGFALAVGNNPGFYHYLRTRSWGQVWNADEFIASLHRTQQSQGATDEPTADRVAYRLAWQTIREQPATFARACLYRVGRFWGLLPYSTTADEGPLRRTARWAVAGWYFVELALAALGVAAGFRAVGGRERWQRTWLWGLALAGVFTAVHVLYWSDLRMRAPVMPAVALAAAAALAWLGARPAGRK